MDKKIIVVNRTSSHCNLKDFCSFSAHNEEDFLEVTKWANSEGYDIVIDVKYNKQQLKFELTYGQFEAIKQCIKTINKS